MKPFDFNIHPNINFSSAAKNNSDIAVVSELTCSADQIISSFKNQFKLCPWSNYISGFNCMIFTSLFHDFPERTNAFTSKLNRICQKNRLSIEYTFLANPRFSESFESILYHWAKAGVKFVKFHSYHQKISDDLIPDCVKIAKIAEEYGIGICVDASYGSLGLYRYDNLKLAAEILLEVKNVPVIILHAGGLRCYEAVLIASSCDNAFVELSFSPHYYANTSVYQSFVDMFQILETTKFLYASDYPYIDLQASLRCAERLFLDAGLTDDDIERVFYGNAHKILKSNR